MAKIAISGGIGAGKSTLAQNLRMRGYQVLDADQIAHECLMKPDLIAKVASRFPQLGELTGLEFRRELAKIVFAYPQELSWLESLIHPCVKARISELYQASGAKLFFVEVPLLAAAKAYDYLIVVTAPESVRIARLTHRGLDSTDIHNRLANQPSEEEYVAAADFIFDGQLQDKAAELALTALLEKLEDKTND